METRHRDCPHCGEKIKATSYKCPYCGESLAVSDQQRWERSTPTPIPALSDSPVTEAKEREVSRETLVLGALLLALVFTLGLYLFLSRDRKPRDTEVVTDVRAASLKDLQRIASLRSEPAPSQPEATTRVELKPRQSPAPGEASDAQKTTPDSAPTIDTAPGEEPAGTKATEDRIEFLTNEILKELRKNQEVVRDTVVLKSGHQFSGTILEESDTHVRLGMGTKSASIDKARIATIQQREPENVERELQETAQARAKEIVEQGLVRYENDWITPKERDLRILERGARLEAARLATNKEAAVLQRKTASPTFGSDASARRIDFSLIEVQEGVGFHDIVTGHPRTTRQLIKSRMGEPDFEEGNVLNYDWKYGIEFGMHEGRDMLYFISFNPGFEGKLSSGIWLASSKQDVFRTYGEPLRKEEVKKLSGEHYEDRVEYVREDHSKVLYRLRGLTFWFIGDRIRQIVVWKI